MSGRNVEEPRLPGEFLRRLGRRLCTDATYERLVEPLVADLQQEYTDVAAGRSPARRGWVRASGIAAFWRAMIVHAAGTAWRGLLLGEPAALSCRGALLRGLGGGSVAMAVVFTALLHASQVSRTEELSAASHALVYLLPSCVAVALPASMLFGCAFAVRRVQTRLVTAHERRATVRSVLAYSGIAVAATFVLTAWVVPRSNHAFRQAVWTTVTGSHQPLEKGDRELTLSELGAGLRVLRAEGRAQAAAQYEVERHKRVALPLACVVCTLLGAALGLDARRMGAVWVGLGGLGLAYGYYVLVRVGESAGDRMLLSPFVSAWGPNLLLGIVSAAWVLDASRTLLTAGGDTPASGPGRGRR